MYTKITKNQFAIGFRIVSVLMILSMLLAGVGVTPASAASPSTISGNAGAAGATITYSGVSTTTDAANEQP